VKVRYKDVRKYRKLIFQLELYMTSRRWILTLNNPLPLEMPNHWDTTNMKLLIVQLERGEEGTMHLQGYIEMKSPVRLTGMKKLLPRAHLEIARGHRLECIGYCQKKETAMGMSWWLHGEDGLVFFENEQPDSLKNFVKSLEDRMNGTKESTSLRLSTIQAQLSSGSAETIEQIADEEFDLWVKYYRAFDRYLLMKSVPRSHKTTVHVLQGPTGTGKSKWAMDFDDNAYWKQRSNWWCGYTKQKTVVLDEFYGWLPFDLLLRLCDRYPMLVETKGGQVQFVAETIIITTNMLPANWYKSAYFPSFVRRVDRWHTLPIWGEHKEYNDYGEFCKDAVENVITP
jgi:hypothetical protein